MDDTMALFECRTDSYEETLKLGARFAKLLGRGDVVCLFGDLGSGKTAFVKGVAKGLGVSGHQVHSPTFTLMNIYEGKIPLYHFDLYRILSGDLFGLGYEEFFYGRGIAAVEWSQRLESLMPKAFWRVELSHVDEDVRSVRISAEDPKMNNRLVKAMPLLRGWRKGR